MSAGVQCSVFSVQEAPNTEHRTLSLRPAIAGPSAIRPLKVLQVLEATEGGTRRHLVDLVTHLDPARFTVSVACSTRRDPGFLDDIRLFEARGIAVHVLPMRRAMHPLWDAVSLIRLVGLMRRARYDVVHTHSSKAGFLGRLAAKLAGVPRVVHTPHVFPFAMDVNRVARFCYFQIEHFAARLTDCLVCVFPRQQRTAITLMDASKVVVVENEIDGGAAAVSGLDGYCGNEESSSRIPAGAARAHGSQGRSPSRRWNHLFCGSNCQDQVMTPGCRGLEGERPCEPRDRRVSDLVVGQVGRLTTQKGPEYFVEAARLMAARVPQVRFVLVGDGPLRAALERRIAAAGLEGRFVMAGESDEAAALLGLMDIVVLPSLWEGLPYVLLDALAAGKAVVATRVGGIPDVVADGVNALLVPPRDAAALAAAVLKLLENAALRATIEEQARKTAAARPGIDMMVARLSDVYEGGQRDG